MQPSTHNLVAALTHHEYLRDQLRAQFPDADEQTLADTLEGESNLDQMLVAVMRSTEDDAMLVTGINERIAELSLRGERLARRIEAKRDICCRVMERANLKKIEAPDFTMSLSATPKKVIVTDEALIPANYKRTPEPPKPVPDKKLIADVLKAGKEVPGAMLSNGGVTLSVRKK